MNDKRNSEIASKYSGGNTTLRELSADYGLSPTRIREIVLHEERRVRRLEARHRAYGTAKRMEDVPLDATDLPIRIKHCFHCAGCKTVGDAMKLTEAELIRAPNFGMKSLREWRKFLSGLPNQFAIFRQAVETEGK